jgi:hypothetical protein
MKLTTHLYLVPRLRMSGAIPPLPHRLSWCEQRQVCLYHGNSFSYGELDSTHMYAVWCYSFVLVVLNPGVTF